MRDSFVVLFDKMPLVVIHGAVFILVTDLLDWYSEHYDIDRSRIDGYWLPQSITYNKDL